MGGYKQSVRVNHGIGRPPDPGDVFGLLVHMPKCLRQIETPSRRTEPSIIFPGVTELILSFNPWMGLAPAFFLMLSDCVIRRSCRSRGGSNFRHLRVPMQ